mmetsp:Transcript_15218/g.17104  ORF Transcript_15218/g.17104 Transcript_15218/m.17104 type:complete len:82 (+) Transcript_15218:77-322(+)
MNFSTAIAVTFFSLHFWGFFTTAFAFAPVISSNSNHNNAIPQQRSSIRRQGSKLNYVQEVQMHGVTLVLGKIYQLLEKLQI